MNEGTPTWRVDKDRERIEHECGERAGEEAERILGSVKDISALLADLGEADTVILALKLSDIWTKKPNVSAIAALRAVELLRSLLWGIAYKRALAAERRKEGLI